jgi:hypothetical protein
MCISQQCKKKLCYALLFLDKSFVHIYFNPTSYINMVLLDVIGMVKDKVAWGVHCIVQYLGCKHGQVQLHYPST